MRRHTNIGQCVWVLMTALAACLPVGVAVLAPTSAAADECDEPTELLLFYSTVTTQPIDPEVGVTVPEGRDATLAFYALGGCPYWYEGVLPFPDDPFASDCSWSGRPDANFGLQTIYTDFWLNSETGLDGPSGICKLGAGRPFYTFDGTFTLNVYDVDNKLLASSSFPLTIYDRPIELDLSEVPRDWVVGRHQELEFWSRWGDDPTYEKEGWSPVYVRFDQTGGLLETTFQVVDPPPGLRRAFANRSDAPYSYTPQPGDEGVWDVEVIAFDNETTTVSDTITLTILPDPNASTGCNSAPAPMFGWSLLLTLLVRRRR